MKRNLATAGPAYLASKLKRGGEMIGVSLLATALLASDEDQEIAETFARMAEAVNPLLDIEALWEGVVEEHPWMDGKLGPLIDWMAGAPDPMVESAREICRFLSTLSVWSCMNGADGDLLAQVIQTMRSVETRTFHLGEYLFAPPHIAALKFLTATDTQYRRVDGEMVLTQERVLPQDGESMMDAWAASGTRVIGLGMLIRMEGRDPANVLWTLQEADGMLLAIAGVNMVLHEMGEQIELVHSRDYQDALLASHAKGFTPQWDLPPASVLEPRW